MESIVLRQPHLALRLFFSCQEILLVEHSNESFLSTDTVEQHIGSPYKRTERLSLALDG